ncbi:MAG: VWA domain-containing protein [Candidatus Solibacter usitatus]|nr:VWA domain-containing protein [Candidatus Solibacter usitatus]
MVNVVKTSGLLAGLCTAALLLAQQPPQPQKPRPEEDLGPAIKVDVDLVNLFFSVRDKKGAYLPTLTKDDLELYEDGKRQEPKFFSRETDLPLTIGLLVDVSRSQEALIEEERRASFRFFTQVLRQKDMAFIISFGADSELLQDYTASPQLLQRGLGQLRLNAGVSGMSPTGPTVPLPGGGRGTVLYESVWLAAKEKLRSEVGRKALVVITDGVDVGSRIKIEKAIEEAQRSDAIIYSVLFEDPRYTSWQYGGMSGEGPMRRMADETGGRVFRVDRKNSLSGIYDVIQKEMRSQYACGYTPANPVKDGAFRRIEVRAKNKDLKVQVRRGYYASKE